MMSIQALQQTGAASRSSRYQAHSVPRLPTYGIRRRFMLCLLRSIVTPFNNVLKLIGHNMSISMQLIVRDHPPGSSPSVRVIPLTEGETLTVR